MLPSASSLQLVKVCPGSAALPHVRTGPSEAMARGTAVHKYLEMLGYGHSKAEALIAAGEDYQAFCASIDLSSLPLGVPYQQEAGLAWDHKTGKGRFFAVEGRNYKDINETEFFGTTDVVGVFLPEGRVEIWDWKVGFGGHLSAPADSMQLRFYALAAARAVGVETAHIGYIKIGDDAEAQVISARLDAFDLSIIEAELREIAKAVAAARAQPVPNVFTGDHCRYCPAFNSCPAQLGMLSKALAGPDGVLKDLKTQDLATIYPVVENLIVALSKLKDSIKETVSETPLLLGGGKQLARIQTQRKEIVDMPKALQVIAERHGREVARKALEASSQLTQIGIKTALEPVADLQGCSVNAAYKEIESDLIGSGAMQLKTVAVTKVVTHKGE